jgi:hypothetical protein
VIGHRVVLRPRSFLETGDLALTFTRRHSREFVRLLPWVVVPAVVAYVLHVAFGWTEEWALTLEFAVTGITSGVFVILCGDLMLEPTASLKSVQKRFLANFIGYFVARLAGWIAIPGLLLFGYQFSAFIPECVLLERGSIGASFTRTGALLGATPGRWIALGATCIVLFFVGAAGTEAFRMTFRSLFGLSADGGHAAKDVLSWAPFLGIALMHPYLAVLRFLLYIDCRTRREGWDLQVQFSALVTAAQSHLRHAGAGSEAA